MASTLTVISSPTATSSAPTTYLLTTSVTSPAPAKIAPKKSSARRSRGSSPTPRGPSVARRNERERNRVRQVNLGFATLRQHVPNRSKKMSKVETLRSAVRYIRQLRTLLGEEAAADEFDEECGGGADENAPSPAGTVPGFAEAFARHQAMQQRSPAPSLGSDASSPYDSLSPEDEELMDFANWLS